MNIKDFFKEIEATPFGFAVYEKYKIASICVKPLELFNYGNSFDREDLIAEIHSLQLGIELKNKRYVFEDLEAYKAFKEQFNLL